MTDQTSYDNKSIKHDAKQLVENIQSKSQEFGETFQTHVNDLSAKAVSAGQRAVKTTQKRLVQASDCVKDGASRTFSYVQKNPGKTLGIAALLGGTIALFMKGKHHHHQRKTHQISGAEKAALVAAVLPILQKIAPRVGQKNKTQTPE